jgi:hypothetical protein
LQREPYIRLRFAVGIGVSEGGPLSKLTAVVEMLLLTLVLGLAAVPVIHAEGSGTEVRLVPGATVVRAADGPFEVTVVVDGVDHHFSDGGASSDSEGLGVFQFALHFNPDMIAVSRMQSGPFLSSTGRGVSCLSQLRSEDRSIFDFACVSTSPPANGPQGSGTLARLTLVPVGTGSSDLVLDGEMGGPLGSTGDDIAFTAIGAGVTVTGSSGSPLASTPTPLSGSQPGPGGAGLGTGNGSPGPGAGGPGLITGDGSSGPAADGATPEGSSAANAGGAGTLVEGPSSSGGGTHTDQSMPWKLALASSLAAVGVLAVLGGVLYRRQASIALAHNLGPLRRAFRSRSARSHGERR